MNKDMPKREQSLAKSETETEESFKPTTVQNIQVVYTDVKKSHRILRFSIDQGFTDDIKIKGFNVQIDEDIVSNEKVVSKGLVGER